MIKQGLKRNKRSSRKSVAKNKTSSRKSFCSKYLIWIILSFLCVFILASRVCQPIADWYVTYIYSNIFKYVSPITSAVHFSLGDVFISICVFAIIIISVYALLKRKWHYYIPLLQYILFVFIWLYMSWGICYFRSNVYMRGSITKVQYDKELFKSFLKRYTLAINANYSELPLSKPAIENIIKQGYCNRVEAFQLLKPYPELTAKQMLFPSFMLYSGIQGYMGPFFTEFNINPLILSVQYPFVYAHEMSHILGVSSESEANFHAYEVCTASVERSVRFSGYISILPYVMADANRLMSANEYRAWVSSLSPQVRKTYSQIFNYYRQHRVNFVDSIQSKIYDLFLKSNSIQSGTDNYSEVIGLIISVENQIDD